MIDEFAPLAPYYLDYAAERASLARLKARILAFDGAAAWALLLEVAQAGGCEIADSDRFATLVGNLERLGIGHDLDRDRRPHRVALRDAHQPILWAV